MRYTTCMPKLLILVLLMSLGATFLIGCGSASTESVYDGVWQLDEDESIVGCIATVGLASGMTQQELESPMAEAFISGICEALFEVFPSSVEIEENKFALAFNSDAPLAAIGIENAIKSVWTIDPSAQVATTDGEIGDELGPISINVDGDRLTFGLLSEDQSPNSPPLNVVLRRAD